ncbi:methyltransferase, FxLD system [Actinopolymorpha pittospori]|uniref:Protein-L-isoaspartate O-methyltransferase n=1 Tax=Actinopolymorpha pittospori TaxID=648752 RepID=A0A927N1A8_9ACTN|nr:methyltransferase, FxLD system [Actinopolymorpha pittospori]MBE1609937.1 protein-L-isoaspartate(D-aspartate) O-methyltransferase [Actinopolymorpha pittospori]
MNATATGVADPTHGPREGMIEALRRYEVIRSDAVEAAMRAVPRHLFVPEVPADQAYANVPVITKRHPDGEPLSSASEPGIIATLLEQLDVAPGQRVLEIGTGIGYNAAVLSHLVGPDGEVTTIEYDAEIAERARETLATTGHDNVRVVHGDGALGHTQRAPYDRVIVSTGAWDVPPAWLDQLTPKGRLVVPLRLPAWSQSVAFERAEDCWASLSRRTCGFIPMDGPAGNPARNIPLVDDEGVLADGDVVLRIDDDRKVDAAALAHAFTRPRQEVWTGVMMDNLEPQAYDHMLLRLATSLDGACKLNVSGDVFDRRLVVTVFRWGGLAVCEEDSLAYVTSRRTGDLIDGTERSWFELGVFAHGPQAADLADRVAGQIRDWNHNHRANSEPRIEIHPIGTPDARLRDAYVVDKRHTRVAVSWVDAAPTRPVHSSSAQGS